MGERVIALPTPYIVREPTEGTEFRTMQAYRPDPDAPSVAEVVEVLRAAHGRAEAGSDWEWRDRLDSLIARLEGE